VARQRGIAEAHAGRLLSKYSRELGRSLRVVAEAIVFDEEQDARFGSRSRMPGTNWSERKQYARSAKTA
jgi:hypothetical protein